MHNQFDDSGSEYATTLKELERIYLDEKINSLEEQALKSSMQKKQNHVYAKENEVKERLRIAKEQFDSKYRFTLVELFDLLVNVEKHPEIKPLLGLEIETDTYKIQQNHAEWLRFIEEDVEPKDQLFFNPNWIPIDKNVLSFFIDIESYKRTIFVINYIYPTDKFEGMWYRCNILEKPFDLVHEYNNKIVFDMETVKSASKRESFMFTKLTERLGVKLKNKRNIKAVI
jgi:hypothetical protein